MKKNNLLKTVLLFIFAIILLQGCREEVKYTENFTPLKPRQDGMDKNVTFREFKKETRIRIDDINSVFSKKAYKNKKTGEETLINEFDIDTTYIKKLKFQTDRVSFSIRAYKKGENPNNNCYNIVYFQKDNEWSYEIFKYTYSQEYLKEYNYNSLTPFSGKIENIKLKSDNKNTKASARNIVTCSYSVQPLCYCADHTPSQCRGCNAGFRNVGVLNCTVSDSGEESGGGADFGVTVIPPFPNIANPPFEDNTSGIGYLDNPYSQSLEFSNNLPSIDDIAFLESTWKYNLWNRLGFLQNDFPEIYSKFEEFHVLTKGQRMQDLMNLSEYITKDPTFVNWGADFLIQNPNTTWTQFQKWFIKADGTTRITFDSSVNSSNAYTINDFSKFQDFVNSIDKTKVTTNFSFDQTTKEVTNSAKFNIGNRFYNGGFIVYNFTTNANSNVFKLKETKVINYGTTIFHNSELFNVSLPVKSTTNSNEYYFDVVVIVKIKLFWQGIGTIYEIPNNIKFVYNQTNGSVYLVDWKENL